MKSTPFIHAFIPSITEEVFPVDSVLPNEKVHLYIEAESPAPDKHSIRRYRVVYFARNGELCEYTEDMGQIDQFKGMRKLMFIPALSEYSLAELLDIADYLRWETEIDVLDRLGLETANLK